MVSGSPISRHPFFPALLSPVKTQSSGSVVECADQLKALYWSHSIARTLMAIGFVFGFLLIGVRTSQAWVLPCGVMFTGIVLVVPHVMKIGRFLNTLQCPNCGRSAGSYSSTAAKVYLRCRHCGEETPTDCMLACAGGPPTRTTEQSSRKEKRIAGLSRSRSGCAHS